MYGYSHEKSTGAVIFPSHKTLYRPKTFYDF